MNCEACAVCLSVTSLTFLILLTLCSFTLFQRFRLPYVHITNTPTSVFELAVCQNTLQTSVWSASSLPSRICSNSTLFRQTYLKLQPLPQCSQTPPFYFYFSLEHLILHNSLYILFILVLPISTEMQLQGRDFCFLSPEYLECHLINSQNSINK